MLTIYSIGDPWYLGKVMDALAMVSGSQSGFIGASKVAMLIGIVIIAFQAILKLQINIHHLLVCFIVYMGCFSVTTDVAIESVYSDKTVIKKDNIPFGPAMIGSIISQLGYGLSKQMEVAFSDVHSYELTGNSGGFLNPLYVINNLASWAEGGSLLQLLEKTPEGKDLAKNYNSYVADCTVKAIYLGRKWGGKSYNDVFTQPQGNDIEFKSSLYGTEFIERNGNPVVLSCTEGYTKLQEQLKSAIDAIDSNDPMKKKIASKVLTECKTGDNTANVACLDARSSGIITNVQGALDAIRASNVNAQQFMLETVLENLKKVGLAEGFRHYRDISTANMLVQAVQQRNLQWASEGSMFLNSMRPMMAFIEGFFYAISPFAAIIMLLGMFGLNIFFKYILLLLWIQLWTPIMTVVNLFIMTTTGTAVESSIGEAITSSGYGSGTGALSTYLYEDIIQICQDKIAVGSMMLAATPVLSLMILTGSVFAFTSLTNRLAGADHFNEKSIAPDISSPASVMQMSPMMKADNFGAQASGASFGKVNLANQAQSLLSYARSAESIQSAQYNAAWSNAMTDVGNHINSVGLNAAYNQMKSFTSSDAFQNLRSNIQNQLDESSSGHSYSKDDIDALSLGVAAGRFGVKIGAGTEYKLSTGESINEVIRNAQGFSNAMSESDEGKLQKALSASLSDTKANNDSFGISAEHKTALTKAMSATKSQKENSNALDSISQCASVNNDLSTYDIVTQTRGVTSGVYNEFKEKLNAYDTQHGTNFANVLETTKDNAKRDIPGGTAAGDSEEIAQFEALSRFNTNSNDSELNSMIIDSKTDLLEGTAKHFGWTGAPAASAEQKAHTSVNTDGVMSEEQLKDAYTGMENEVNNYNSNQNQKTNASVSDFYENQGAVVENKFNTAKDQNQAIKETVIEIDRGNFTNTGLFIKGENAFADVASKVNALAQHHDYQSTYAEHYKSEAIISGSLTPYAKNEEEREIVKDLIDLRTKASTMNAKGTNESREIYDGAKTIYSNKLEKYAYSNLKPDELHKNATEQQKAEYEAANKKALEDAKVWAKNAIDEFGYENVARSQSDIIKDIKEKNKFTFLNKRKHK